MLDYFIQLGNHESIDIQNVDGWTPAHFAGCLNNFDALNLLIENGANICKKHKQNLTCYDEIIRSDNAELIECVYPIV
jgi:ankyrin repeat protein